MVDAQDEGLLDQVRSIRWSFGDWVDKLTLWRRRGCLVVRVVSSCGSALDSETAYQLTKGSNGHKTIRFIHLQLSCCIFSETESEERCSLGIEENEVCPHNVALQKERFLRENVNIPVLYDYV